MEIKNRPQHPDSEIVRVLMRQIDDRLSALEPELPHDLDLRTRYVADRALELIAKRVATYR